MAGEKTTIPAVFLPLVRMIAADFVPAKLTDIIERVFTGSTVELKNIVLNSLQRKLNGQTSRSSAQAFTHALIYQIDHVVDAPESPGVPQEKKNELGEALAQQAAHELAKAAAFLLDYPGYQNVVALAKATGDPGHIATARKERDAAQERFKQSMINVGRLLAGDVPQEQ